MSYDGTTKTIDGRWTLEAKTLKRYFPSGVVTTATILELDNTHLVLETEIPDKPKQIAKYEKKAGQ